MTLTLWAISYTVVGLLVAGFEAVRAGWDDNLFTLKIAPFVGAIWPVWLLKNIGVLVSVALYDFGQRLRERQS